MRVCRVLPFTSVILAVVAVAAFGEAADEDALRSESLAEGAKLYDVYCSNCHGTSGKGNGPTAKLLRVKPSNLTKLTRRGKFPVEEIYDVIDGRRELPGHGYRREMPIWGLSFQDPGSDVNQQLEIRARISRLVDYLESIQKK